MKLRYEQRLFKIMRIE